MYYESEFGRSGSNCVGVGRLNSKIHNALVPCAPVQAIIQPLAETARNGWKTSIQIIKVEKGVLFAGARRLAFSGNDTRSVSQTRSSAAVVKDGIPISRPSVRTQTYFTWPNSPESMQLFHQYLSCRRLVRLQMLNNHVISIFCKVAKSCFKLARQWQRQR